jgi:2-polyprenyl-3-methyl-5-hydroxy-6-metoxy-1,4-benzoquinol methylase/uncharacterized protein YbaR (Trm112 family)
MRSTDVTIYACPSCNEALSIVSLPASAVRERDRGEAQGGLHAGAQTCETRDAKAAASPEALSCARCKQVYPVVDGIARFVPAENYARSFGFQWNLFQDTQLDSRNGLGRSAQRLWDVSQWPRHLAGELVLEAGSGAGRFTEVLAPTDARLFTFDYSNAVEANHRVNGRFDNVAFAQADIFRMPFREGTFDRVICLGVLQHTPSARGALRALVRMLRPGGHLVIDHYRFNALTLFRAKYALRLFTAGREPARLLPIVKAWFSLWYSALGALSHAVGPLTTHLAELVGVCDYRYEIANASRELVRDLSLLDTFDMLSPKFDRPRTIGTIRAWLEAEDLVDIEVGPGPNGVVARARKKPGAHAIAKRSERIGRTDSERL